MCPALPVEFKKNNFWRKKSSFKKSTIFEPILPPRNPWVSSKNVSQFGPAVWPAIIGYIANMQINIYERRLFYNFLDPRVKNYWEIQTVENLKDIIIYNNCFFPFYNE